MYNLEKLYVLYNKYKKGQVYAHQTLCIYDIEQKVSNALSIVIYSDKQFPPGAFTDNILTYIQLHQLTWKTTKITIQHNILTVLVRDANVQQSAPIYNDVLLRLLTYYYMDHNVVDHLGKSFIHLDHASAERKSIYFTLQKYHLL